MNIELHTTIAGGLPCIARMIDYSPPRNNQRGHIDNWLPNDEEEFDFELLTIKGNPAPWMEKRITDEDRNKIMVEFSELMVEERREQRYESCY